MSESERLKWQVVVDALPGEYVVETFSDEYAEHVKSKEVKEPAGFFSFIGLLISGLLCLVGFLTLIFGPSTGMVRALSGPTFFQFIQLNPEPIISVGAIFVCVFSWFLNPGVVMTHEQYLLKHYSVVCPDDTELNKKVVAEYRGENTFRISPAETSS